MPEAIVPAVADVAGGDLISAGTASALGLTGAGAVGEAVTAGSLAGGFTLANAAQAANIIGAGISAYGSLTNKKMGAPQLPGAPPAAPTMQSPSVDSAIEIQQRKAAAAGGIMSNIGTSPQGTMLPPTTTGKTLLGQ